MELMHQVTMRHVEFDEIEAEALRALGTLHKRLNNSVDPSFI